MRAVVHVGLGLVLVSASSFLSNLQLPLDTAGNRLRTGETSVFQHGDFWYFYVNDWGGCADVDCCPSVGGCASCCYVPPTPRFPDPCVFTSNHTVLVYRTPLHKLDEWELLGPALEQKDRPAGIEFRPHVIYNPVTRLFVMWFEDRPKPISSSGYMVATSTSPRGPFRTISGPVAVADVPGDFGLLVVPASSKSSFECYHVQTTTNDPNATKGFVVTLLDSSCTKQASIIDPSTGRNRTVTARFEAPVPAEGPVFFRRRRGGDQYDYYILAGTTCCACRGGSSIFVFRAPSPLGPWRYQGDVGSTTQAYDPHSPTNYVTRAQASCVLVLDSNRSSDGAEDVLWMGNQWVTGEQRNADLLYWALLPFDDNSGAVKQLHWQDNVTVY